MYSLQGVELGHSKSDISGGAWLGLTTVEMPGVNFMGGHCEDVLSEGDHGKQDKDRVEQGSGRLSH